jgi:hypothetical protein
VPVPSVLESFCIQEMPNWPTALELKMALFGDVAVMGGLASGALYRFFFKGAYAAARLIPLVRSNLLAPPEGFGLES